MHAPAKSLLDRSKAPKKLKGATIKTPGGEFLCVSLHVFGITLKDYRGNIFGVEWKDTGDFIALF